MTIGYTRLGQVTAPAASQALTTLKTVCDDLQIDPLADNSYLGRLIARASRAISTYCRRLFALAGYQDTFRRVRTIGHRLNGNETPDDPPPLILSACPIVAIEAVTIDGILLVAGVDYEFDADAGLLYRLGIAGLRQPWVFEIGTVSYTAGWVLPVDNAPDGAPLRTLPEDVEEAAIGLIQLAYAARSRDASVKMELLFDVRRVEYFDPSAGQVAQLPAGIDLQLQPYRLPLVP